MEKKFETVSAESFRDENRYYVFPFVALDPTPGGNNLGRIEWHIEPIRSKKKERGMYFIEKLYVWASQTYDERYKGKVFEIPCFAECITASALRDRDSYLHHVWKAQICELHKSMWFSAYPQNHHTSLKINVGSSISIDADFK